MARSEFRYNRRRKHYSYLFKDVGSKRKNIKLYKNPNPNKDSDSYMIPIVYLDSIDSFDKRKLKWSFHSHDKRKVKRLKKNHKISKVGSKRIN